MDRLRDKYPDLLEILAKFGEVVPSLIMMMQGIVVVIGLYLTISALIDIWGASYDNAVKYVGAGHKFSYGGAIIKLFIGAIMLSMGTLEWVGVMSRTIMAENNVSSRVLAYKRSGSSMEEAGKLATTALLGIMQLVGFIALTKGWLTINRYYNNQQTKDSLGKAFGWIIGGVIAWNFEWFAVMINNSVGLNIINLFSPFSKK